jgi:hypothetical protein
MFALIHSSQQKEDSISKKRRICRFGCGVEIKPGSCLTPGFTNVEKPTIINDCRGFKRIQIPRKRIRRGMNIIPTSSWLVLGWRANCDVQFIRYETDPCNPDPTEISKVTDYLVSYNMKGNERFTQEKDYVRELINTAETISDDGRDLKTVVRKVLNRSLASKLISKQEAMVQLTNLRLYECSERIQYLSLSSGGRIDHQESSCTGNKIITIYANRIGQEKKSLYEFFLEKENKVN